MKKRCAQSQLIADTVDIQLDLGQRHFPTYKLPPRKDRAGLSARAVPGRA